jgi:hypothetical protein
MMASRMENRAGSGLVLSNSLSGCFRSGSDKAMETAMRIKDRLCYSPAAGVVSSK